MWSLLALVVSKWNQVTIWGGATYAVAEKCLPKLTWEDKTTGLLVGSRKVRCIFQKVESKIMYFSYFCY